MHMMYAYIYIRTALTLYQTPSLQTYTQPATSYLLALPHFHYYVRYYLLATIYLLLFYYYIYAQLNYFTK
jgi:hypothetical protein